MWGKIIGGVAGFAAGGPFGAMVGAALGHAAENGGLRMPGGGAGASFNAARIAGMLGRRDEVFALCAVVLSARLAKCDGPVNRVEIDAFKRHFRTPPEAAADIGRLFDRARDSTEPFEPYAAQLGQTFADRPEALETVLAALFAIARADKPITVAEQHFLQTVCVQMGLGLDAWARAQAGRPQGEGGDAGFGGQSSFGDNPHFGGPNFGGPNFGGSNFGGGPFGYGGSRVSQTRDDAYAVLGVTRSMPDEELRSTWKRLMRENHPDSLASRGVAPELIARAGDRVARINAAWDSIKRERGL